MTTVVLPDVTWADVNEVVNAGGLTPSDVVEAINGAKNGNIGSTNLPDYNGDLDDLLVTGFFLASDIATNSPPNASGSGFVVTSVNDTDLITQFYIEQTINRVYFRTGRVGGSLNDWAEFYTENNLGVVEVKRDSDGGGQQIFSNIGSNPTFGELYATGLEGTADEGNYITLSCYKAASSTDVIATTIASNNLSVQATNSGGTVALTGFTDSANIRMIAVKRIATTTI